MSLNVVLTVALILPYLRFSELRICEQNCTLNSFSFISFYRHAIPQPTRIELKASIGGAEPRLR